MTNWILIAGLGLGAYYLYSQKTTTSNSDPIEPIQLKLSSTPGVYEVPIAVVKQYGAPDYTTADTLYVPAPVFTTMPVKYAEY